ncbi:hypothetical protein Tco_1212216 [Tanacetum coccineum]
MREEANTTRNLVGQLNALIAEMEALEDQGELFDTLMDLRDDREAARTKLQGLNELITQAEQEIEIKEAQIQFLAMVLLGIKGFYKFLLRVQLSTAKRRLSTAKLNLIFKEKMESQSETTQTVSALKLLVLKTGDYDLWSMRMEQYLTHTNYALWEVIMNGDAPAAIASASVGTEGPIPPKTAEQKLARKNELKEKKHFAVSELISQLEIHGEVISQEDTNLKLLRSLPSAWNNIALIMRNKSDLDTLSMDDLYNNLKVYEAEIKRQSSSSSNSQNVAFVSLENTSSTNEAVNTAHDVTIASSPRQAPSSTYADDVMFSFFANQSNSSQLDNEDLEQIDTDDLEEMDLK